MRMNGFAIFPTTLLIVAFVLSVAAAADQNSGTWKMNPAKSKYSPGPTPRSLTVKVDCDENVWLAKLQFARHTLREWREAQHGSPG